MDINDLLTSATLASYTTVKYSPYSYNNVNLPRVTEILSSMLHEEFLMKWANSLGFKHKNYTTARDEAAVKGTYVHNAIQDYLTNGIDFDPDKIENYTMRVAAVNGYNSFMSWWNEITKNNTVKVIMQEETLTCPYFGGTLDLLLDINGSTVLVDFKTSNHLTYKYILQLAAYRYMLKQRGIVPNICCIIKLNKDNIDYEELVIDLSDYQDAEMMNHAEDAFLSLVYSYLQRQRIEEEYRQKIKRNN